jgi:hypothetical protein
MSEEEFYVALSRAWDAMEGWLMRHGKLLLGIACITVLAMLIHGCWATPHITNGYLYTLRSA